MKDKNKRTAKKIPPRPSARSSGIEGILQAYFELAHSMGVDKITLASLSEKTGLSPSNVKYHIDNSDISLEKIAIQKVRQSVNMYLDEKIFLDRVEKKFDPLKSYAKHMLQWSQDYPQFSTYLLFVYYRTSTSMGFESGEDRYENILKKAVGRIESLLNEGIGMGLYTVETAQRKEFIATFHALVLGQLVILINLKPKTEISSWLSHINSFIKSISK